MTCKRLLLLVLTLCTAASLLAVNPLAADMTLEEQIIDSCTYDRTADISQHKLTKSQLETLFYGMRYAGKLPWYTENSYTYYYSDTTGYLLKFEPDVLDKESYDRMLYEQKVAEVLAACVQEDMQDWQIALSIHDYLIANCVYDEAEQLRTGYDLLIKGSTVCSGYAELYQDLLTRCGIPCLQVESEAMEHVWNLVQLDEKWYHVDVTWDDPTPDTKGFVQHKYFLRTDAEMSAGEDPHHDWETDITCTDTTYSNAFWKDVDSQIIFADANSCCFIREKDCRNSIYRRDISTGKETRLYREKETYLNIGKGGYAYYHCGLSLWNDRLWFCTMNKVCSMTLKGTDVRTEYTYNTSANKRILGGCHVTEDTIYLSAADHDGNCVPVTQTLKSSGGHTHSYTQTVTPPTCTQPGYTVSVCQCGLQAKGDPVAAKEHSWQQTFYHAPTIFSPGSEERKCSNCGETESQVLPQVDIGQWLSENGKTVYIAVVIVIVLISSKKRKKA